MAYNVLAIARAVHLRRQRLIGWQQLRDGLRDALLWWGLVDDDESEQSLAPVVWLLAPLRAAPGIG